MVTAPPTPSSAKEWGEKLRVWMGSEVRFSDRSVSSFRSPRPPVPPDLPFPPQTSRSPPTAGRHETREVSGETVTEVPLPSSTVPSVGVTFQTFWGG